MQQMLGDANVESRRSTSASWLKHRCFRTCSGLYISTKNQVEMTTSAFPLYVSALKCTVELNYGREKNLNCGWCNSYFTSFINLMVL